MSAEGWPVRLVTVLVKGQSVLLKLGLRWAIKSCGGCSTACPAPPSRESIELASQRNPIAQAPPITVDRSHPSIRAIQRQGWIERNEITNVKAAFMLNFAKRHYELRPLCALLILTTFTRIKKHLHTEPCAWINHGVTVKGTIIPLSSHTWQFSQKW